MDFLIDHTSGRLYSVVLSQCTLGRIGSNNTFEETKEKLIQLEIEYAGILPGYSVPSLKADLQSLERIVVEEIIGLQQALKISNKLEPTRLTKYEWIIQRKRKK